MADGVELFEILLNHLKARQPGVRGEARSTWGAQTIGYRREIRQSIASTLSDWRHEDFRTLHELDQPPRPFNYSISISHTRDFGGWIAVPRPAQIGWDIELKDRIRPDLVERVCDTEDISMAPEAGFLWCAKEAFFKSLEDDQPDVLTVLNIGEWKKTPGGTYTFAGLGPRNSEGILLEGSGWIMAACLIF